MLSEKPWTPEAVLRLFLGVFMCAFGGGVIAGLLDKSLDESIWPSVIMIASVQGMALVLIGNLLRRCRIPWNQAFGFTNRQSRALGTGLIAAICFMPVGWGVQLVSIKLMEQFDLAPVQQTAVETLTAAYGLFEHVILAVAMIVIAPIAEEMLFRGILYPVIKQSGHPRLAFWGVAFAFAAVHFNLASLPALFVLGLLLTLLYERTNNLLASIAAHALFNAMNYTLFYLAEAFGKSLPSQS